MGSPFPSLLPQPGASCRLLFISEQTVPSGILHEAVNAQVGMWLAGSRSEERTFAVRTRRLMLCRGCPTTMPGGCPNAGCALMPATAHALVESDRFLRNPVPQDPHGLSNRQERCPPGDVLPRPTWTASTSDVWQAMASAHGPAPISDSARTAQPGLSMTLVLPIPLYVMRPHSAMQRPGRSSLPQAGCGSRPMKPSGPRTRVARNGRVDGIQHLRLRRQAEGRDPRCAAGEPFSCPVPHNLCDP